MVVRTTSHPEALSAVLTAATEKALLIASIKVQNEARKILTDHVDTGALRQSITYVIDGTSAKTMVARVGSNLEYAAHVEFGTRAHVIRPRNKKALSFKIGSKKIIATLVYHPGTDPVRYLRDALKVLG